MHPAHRNGRQADSSDGNELAALAVGAGCAPAGGRAITVRLPIGRKVILDININLVMVEDGQAFAYRQYLGSCDAKEYLDAEFRASRHRYGVWQVEVGLTRPWDFCRGRRSAAIPDGTTPDGRRYGCKEMGKPVKPCADWVSAGTGTGTPSGHRQLKKGVR